MKVTDNVYALESTKGTYAYVIIDQPVILIDSGRPGQGKNILSELASLNVRPADVRHILLTHFDIDHMGNVAFLERETGASVWASQTEIPYILDEIARPGHKRLIAALMPAKKPQHVQSLSDKPIADKVAAIPTPGHTPGHVSYLYKHVLFAGDLVVTLKGRIQPSPAFMNWNTAMLMDSIAKTGAYPFRYVCPAHGRPVEREQQWEMLSKA